MEYNFHRYGSYIEMVEWMQSLANRFSNFVQFISIGKTHEGRSIDGLEVYNIYLYFNRQINENILIKLFFCFFFFIINNKF